MPFIFSLIFVLSVFTFWLLQRGRSPRRSALQLAEERSLWSTVAEGIFDHEESSQALCLEITLKAVAAKLGVSGAFVAIHGNTLSRTLFSLNSTPDLAAGLAVPSDSIYYGSLENAGDLIVIHYSSLTAWRDHRALTERAWESYIAVNCGYLKGEPVVLAFFDSKPKEIPFSEAEKNLMKQIAPWVAAMLSGSGESLLSNDETPIFTPELLPTAATESEILVPVLEESSILEITERAKEGSNAV